MKQSGPSLNPVDFDTKDEVLILADKDHGNSDETDREGESSFLTSGTRKIMAYNEIEQKLKRQKLTIGLNHGKLNP